MFVARKVGSLVGLGKNYNKLVPSWFDHHREFFGDTICDPRGH